MQKLLPEEVFQLGFKINNASQKTLVLLHVQSCHLNHHNLYLFKQIAQLLFLYSDILVFMDSEFGVPNCQIEMFQVEWSLAWPLVPNLIQWSKKSGRVPKFVSSLKGYKDYIIVSPDNFGPVSHLIFPFPSPWEKLIEMQKKPKEWFTETELTSATMPTTIQDSFTDKFYKNYTENPLLAHGTVEFQSHLLPMDWKGPLPFILLLGFEDGKQPSILHQHFLAPNESMLSCIFNKIPDNDETKKSLKVLYRGYLPTMYNMRHRWIEIHVYQVKFNQPSSLHLKLDLYEDLSILGGVPFRAVAPQTTEIRKFGFTRLLN